MTIQKIGSASTLDIITAIKKLLPSVQNDASARPSNSAPRRPICLRPWRHFRRFTGGAHRGLPYGCHDSSVSWKLAQHAHYRYFDPLSILTSIIFLSALGETINIMTLGVWRWLSAPGDDATVTIENIHGFLSKGKETEEAILLGAEQIAVPALVSTLSICIVFVPMFCSPGSPVISLCPWRRRSSSRCWLPTCFPGTLIPTMAKYLLKAHAEEGSHAPSKNPLCSSKPGLKRSFERFGPRIADTRSLCPSPPCFCRLILAACVLSFGLYPGWDKISSHPWIVANSLHLRAPTGMRIEETAALCDRVEAEDSQPIPPARVAGVIDNIGLPYSGINLSYSSSAPIGTEDADIMVALSPKHRPTAGYVHDLRLKLSRDFPGVTFYFLPSDMVTQILNFGLPAQSIFKLSEIICRPTGNLRTSCWRGSSTFREQRISAFSKPLTSRNFTVDVDRTKARESVSPSEKLRAIS